LVMQRTTEYKAGALSVHYKEGTEFSGSGFNADYYDLNWLSNNVCSDSYVNNDTPTRDRMLSITVRGLVVKDLSTTSP
jgi:hypothetical protein